MQSTLRSWGRNMFGTLFMFLIVAVPGLEAQTGTVTGRVTDGRSGQPVSAVQVYIDGLDVGVLTQQNGRYLLQNVPAGSHTLSAERLGYRAVSEQISVGAGQSVVQNLAIDEEALQLDEVIVTGTPGGTQRRAIGNSVATVDASEVTDLVPIANMQEMLSARTPGVDFTRLTGNVGAGSSVQVRGFSSLTLSSQPVIFVDGVRVTNDFNAGPAGRGLLQGASGGQASTLDDFNPEDIESIEIIKGPAAATLYGSEASAGVIQIITKRGQAGAPQFNFTVSQGSNFMIDPAGVIGDQYGCNVATSFFNPVCPSEEVFRFNIYENEKNVHGNDVFGYGRTQAYNLNVRGGSDAIRYFVSADWSDETGIVDYNWDETLRLRANLNTVLTDALSLDVSTGFTQGQTRFAQPHPSEGGSWDDMIWAQGDELDGPLRGFQDRLPEDVATVRSLRDYSRFTGSFTTTHTVADWLTQRLVLGLDRSWDEDQIFVPRHELGIDGPYDEDSEGYIDLERPERMATTVDYSASGEYQLNDRLNFTTSVGAQYYYRNTDRILTVARNFVSPLIENLSGATEHEPVDHDITESKSFGMYIQEQIGINDRIFITAALRGDDNSTFGNNFDLIYYPKLSATWTVSEENFWNIDLVNSLRLRGAWGEAGRQPNVFSGLTRYIEHPGPGGTPAVIPIQTGNPDVGPERSSEIEGGFDIAMLNDRLSAEFTYFHQTVSDALTNQDLPPSMGYPLSIDSNLGEMENWGWEAAIDARVVELDNFAFDLRLSGDHTDNEVTSLDNRFLEGENFREGLPYPNVASRVLVSADPDPSDPNGYLNAMCLSGAGDSGWELGGDVVPCADAADAVLVLGRAFYTHNWSVAPTVTLFDNLQIFALAEGAYGRWLANYDAQYRNTYRNTEASVRQDDPMYLAAQDVDDERYAGRFDADFWKLREVGARFQLPDAWIQRAGADRASLSVSGRNLWTIWRKQEEDLAGTHIPDPELTDPLSVSPNFSLGQMPPISNITATLRVSF